MKEASLFEPTRLVPGSPRLVASVYVGDAEQARAIGAIFGVALRELAGRYQPVTAALRKARVPTRVLWGDRDPFFPVTQAERTAGLVDGTSVIRVSAPQPVALKPCWMALPRSDRVRSSTDWKTTATSWVNGLGVETRRGCPQKDQVLDMRVNWTRIFSVGESSLPT